jgi:hypothetical protein
VAIAPQYVAIRRLQGEANMSRNWRKTVSLLKVAILVFLSACKDRSLPRRQTWSLGSARCIALH